ncbi:MAG: YybH family protein [Gammaproteobacteria bacterium]
MYLQQTPITGSEDLSNYSDPMKALGRFYKAFNSSDLTLMTDNWLRSEEASLANPLGGLRRGWNEIRSFYENLFTGPAEVYVEYYDYSVHEFDEIFIAVGRERGQFRIDGTAIELAIRTSRTYLRTEDGWKQIHHHGSIENPDLLRRYQDAVFNRSAIGALHQAVR